MYSSTCVSGLHVPQTFYSTVGSVPTLAESPLAAVLVSMFLPRSCPVSSLFLAPSDSLLVPLLRGSVFTYLLR